MRRELLRQIAHLEKLKAQFETDNCPFEPVSASQSRGPGILPTASLEEIRDELAAAEAALRERQVARAAARLDEAPRRRGWLRRLFGRRDG